MRLATVSSAGRTTAAVQVAGEWRALDAPDLSSAIERGLDVSSPGPAVMDPQLLRPLPRPGKVICCGLNYGDHIAETGRDRPEFPTLFAKHADTLAGPDDEIAVPTGVELDWEAELAVVVGSTVRHATRAEASAAILGYAVANDVSVRDWQRRTLQWFQGKAWDATTPLGPVIVTSDEFNPTAGAAVSCRVDGVERQRGDAATLVFDSADLIAYISTFTVLRPGDIVLTGTPGGVGMGMSPPRYLADGQVVETHIEGIGTLTNRIRFT